MKTRNGTLETSLPGQTFQNLRQKLSELREEKKAILEKCGDVIFAVHPVSGEIFETNGKAAAITGYPVSELQEMNLEQLSPKQEILTKTVESYSLNGNGRIRVALKRREGPPICVEMSACPIHRAQKSPGLVFLRRLHQVEGHSECPAKNTQEPVADHIDKFPFIIGKSEKIRKICQLIGQVARTDSTVLIQGESGTGKEIAAQAIHSHSFRSKGPFVKVNCAALSETLLESKPFGHVKGAFTGAIREYNGRFKQADGGTILLDEIGCMSLSGQAKLLRVLEEREFEPVGSSATIPVDVRIIAASKMELKNAVAEGKFREDLYYRLNVFAIFMPPLREKKKDIPLLAQHFLRKYNLIVGKEIWGLAPETLTLMMQYDWPGNVRELKNAIEHAVILTKGPVILPSDLPTNLTMPDMVKENINFPGEFSLRDKLNLFEKQIIEDTLRYAKGVKKKAAALLRIDPKNLSYLLRKHGLSVLMLCHFWREYFMLSLK